MFFPDRKEVFAARESYKSITMNKKHQAKLKAREAREKRQARRVINGIFIGLIFLMVVFLISYYLMAG